MKKLLYSILAVLFASTLYACDNADNGDNGDDWDLDPDSDTPITDITEMPEYEGLSFTTDGIGEVELFACRDGDTADFVEGDYIFRVRFLGIDTPESGHLYEPWGLAASKYACDVMRNADTLVLEAETPGERGNFGRYLGYVWADGRLLNLELVELGYSTARFANRTYSDELFQADIMAGEKNIGVFGRENDPDFPYDSETVDVTIETLITAENPEDYYLRHFNVEGVVTARFGAHVFLQDDSTGHGIFLFAHYNNFNPDLSIGNEVRLEGAQFYRDGKPWQSFFLTDYDNIDIEVLDTDVEYEVHTIPLDTLDESHSGLYARYENLTITGFSENEMTLFAEDEEGNEIAVFQPGEDYITNSLWPRSFRISEWSAVDDRTLEVGDTFSLNTIITERRAHGMTLLLLGDDHFELHENE